MARFFVADGYGNTRVVKFDKRRQGAPEVGKPRHRAGPVQHTARHCCRRLAAARLRLRSRQPPHSRCSTSNGKFLEEWPGIAPHSMLMSADEHVWAVDSLTDRIVKFDLTGHVEFSFGQFGTQARVYVGTASNLRRFGRQSLSIRGIRWPHAEVTGRSRAPIRQGWYGAAR